MCTLLLHLQHSEGTESLPTAQNEVKRSSLPVTPCLQPASLKYYQWQPPEAAIAEVHGPPFLSTFCHPSTFIVAVFSSSETGGSKASLHHWLQRAKKKQCCMAANNW